MHYVHQDKDTNEVAEVLVRENEIVEGYKYGSTIVPFTGTFTKFGFLKISNVCKLY